MRHALQRGFSRRHNTFGDDSDLKTQASFDFEEPPDDDLNTEKIEEILKKFREGGRFEYNQEQKNYLEIKYW